MKNPYTTAPARARWQAEDEADAREGLYEAAVGLCGPQRPADPTPYLPALQAAILRYCRVFGKRPPNLHPETWT